MNTDGDERVFVARTRPRVSRAAANSPPIRVHLRSSVFICGSVFLVRGPQSAAMSDLPLSELTRFGITPADEHPHPYSPDYEWWNESVFYDWYDHTGSNAGHCRIGWHPNQQRLWVWLFLYNGAEWVAV